MKTKRIILTLLFISNLLFLPNTCLAVVSDSECFVNKQEERCGCYYVDYFSLLSYRPPKNWEMINGLLDRPSYCGDVIAEQIKPRISGLSSGGYLLLLILVIFTTGFSRLMLWGFGKRFINGSLIIKKISRYLSLFFVYSIIFLILLFVVQSIIFVSLIMF